MPTLCCNMSKEKRVSKDGRQGDNTSSIQNQPKGKRELITIMKKQAGLRLRKEGPASIEGADLSNLTNLISSEGFNLQPLFGVREEIGFDSERGRNNWWNWSSD